MTIEQKINSMMRSSVVQKTFRWIGDNTVNYRPQRYKLQSKKTRALIAGGIAAGAYMLDYKLVAGGALAYSTLMMYQAVRDWAGK